MGIEGGERSRFGLYQFLFADIGLESGDVLQGGELLFENCLDRGEASDVVEDLGEARVEKSIAHLHRWITDAMQEVEGNLVDISGLTLIALWSFENGMDQVSMGQILGGD